MFVALLLSACGREPAAATAADALPGRQTFSPSSPQPLLLTVHVTPLTHGARLLGVTNLPDGTELMLSVSRASVSASQKVSVSGGRFTQDLYPNDGKPIPPGAYEVEVMTPLGDLQPDPVKVQLGSDYEALTGPLLVKDEFGRVVEYKSKVQLDGPPDATADRAARRKAYRDHVAFSEQTCRSNPDTLERLTGVRLSAEQRTQKVRDCLTSMAASRKQLAAEGLIEP